MSKRNSIPTNQTNKESKAMDVRTEVVVTGAVHFTNSLELSQLRNEIYGLREEFPKSVGRPTLDRFVNALEQMEDDMRAKYQELAEKEVEGVR